MGSPHPSESQECAILQSTQNLVATQVNEDVSQLHSQSQDPLNQLLTPSPKKPWAILHSLSALVPTVKLYPDKNCFGIGRHRGDPPPNAPFRVDLPLDSKNDDNLSISRWHALIQRKGCDDEDESAFSNGPQLAQPIISLANLPHRGMNSKMVISIYDYSTNGTFINGTRCTPKCWNQLEHGHEIALGSMRGNVNKPSKSFVWLVSIPSQTKLLMSQLPSRQSSACKKVYERYDFLLSLGKGAFATTWKAFDRRTGEYRAIKVIQKSDHFDDPRNLINFQREVEILRKINHPNIVKFHESHEDEELIWIVLELVDGGEFLDYVISSKGLDEDPCRWITIMLLEALEYLSRLRIAHRDLKPENILMSSGKNPQAKIADFGLAKQVRPGTCLKSHCGTPAYVAPEVVIPDKNMPGYTVAVDMYSLGVIVYASLANRSPFEGEELDHLKDFRVICAQRHVDTKILSRLKPDLSGEALDFIDRLTVKDVSKRLTPAQALKHPWIAQLASQRWKSHIGLPENPVRTRPKGDHDNSGAAQKEGDRGQSEVSAPHEPLLDPVRGQALDLNDMNVGSEFKAAKPMEGVSPVGVKKFCPSGPCNQAEKASYYEDIHLQQNSYLDQSDVFSLDDHHSIDDCDLGSATSAFRSDIVPEEDQASADAPPEECSQKLKQMRIETPDEASPETPREDDDCGGNKTLIASERIPCSNRTRFGGGMVGSSFSEDNEEEDEEIGLTRTKSKRKLRQWSTSPRLGKVSSVEEQRKVAVGSPTLKDERVEVIHTSQPQEQKQQNLHSQRYRNAKHVGPPTTRTARTTAVNAATKALASNTPAAGEEHRGASSCGSGSAGNAFKRIKQHGKPWSERT